MWKKGLSLLVFVFSILSLTGCENVYELTEEESKLIAEYSAELLLKYDLNYDDRISEGKQAEEKMVNEGLEDRSEAATTEAVTEENDDMLTTETTENDEVVGGQADTESSVGTEGDIAKIVGLEGISIQYKDYLVTDQYPAADDEGEFIYLEPTEGYQLLVLQFNVQNTSEAAVDVSLMNAGLDYRLVCNGVKAAKPMLTILMEDLGTLETTVNAGEEQKAVLVFQISKDMKDQLESVELYINYNAMDNVIEIL